MTTGNLKNLFPQVVAHANTVGISAFTGAAPSTVINPYTNTGDAWRVPIGPIPLPPTGEYILPADLTGMDCVCVARRSAVALAAGLGAPASPNIPSWIDTKVVGTQVLVTFDTPKVQYTVKQGSNVVGTLCPTESTFTVGLTLSSTPDDAATSFILTLVDPDSVNTNVTISILEFVLPKAPAITAVLDPDDTALEGGPTKPTVAHNKVGIHVESHTDTDLLGNTDQYQIERYITNSTNREILRDWSPVSRLYGGSGSIEGYIWDTYTKLGVEYGYRVRYRAESSLPSKWSAWTTITN